jgi:hypothetical protein
MRLKVIPNQYIIAGCNGDNCRLWNTMLIAFLLYRNNRNKKKANYLLQRQKEEMELQRTNIESGKFTL